MSILTINLPSVPKDNKVMVPGIKGDFENGYRYDVGDQIPNDMTIGEDLDENTKVRDLTMEQLEIEEEEELPVPGPHFHSNLETGGND